MICLKTSEFDIFFNQPGQNSLTMFF